jgi:hypothetical protein
MPQASATGWSERDEMAAKSADVTHASSTQLKNAVNSGDMKSVATNRLALKVTLLISDNLQPEWSEYCFIRDIYMKLTADLNI